MASTEKTMESNRHLNIRQVIDNHPVGRWLTEVSAEEKKA